jgi:hypothetical protein
LIPFLHPLLAAATFGGAIWIATLGFQGRRRGERRDLDAHRRWAPVVFAAMLVTWAAGLATVVTARPDLDAAASTHFLVGSAIAALFGVSALTSRRIDVPAVRALHPWLGALALLLCGVQTFLGLALLP